MKPRITPVLLLATLAAVPAGAQNTRPRNASADTVVPPAVFGPLPQRLARTEAELARLRRNPRVFAEIDVRPHGFQPFRNPPEIRSTTIRDGSPPPHITLAKKFASGYSVICYQNASQF
jgi:hypothetical protein